MDIFLGTLFVVICILLIVVVLLQKGRGGGLTAMLGGAGTSAFGTKTGDVFTWVTIILTALFLIVAIGLCFACRPEVQYVAKPGFLPPGGPITGPTKVTLVCATDGAQIFYTTDESDPTKDSAKYNVPVEVVPPMIMKVRAFRKGMKDSQIAVERYWLATTLPAATQPAEAGEAQPQTLPATREATTRPGF